MRELFRRLFGRLRTDENYGSVRMRRDHYDSLGRFRDEVQPDFGRPSMREQLDDAQAREDKYVADHPELFPEENNTAYAYGKDS